MTLPTKIIPFRRPLHPRGLSIVGEGEGFPRFARERNRLPLPLHVMAKERPDGRPSL